MEMQANFLDIALSTDESMLLYFGYVSTSTRIRPFPYCDMWNFSRHLLVYLCTIAIVLQMIEVESRSQIDSMVINILDSDDDCRLVCAAE